MIRAPLRSLGLAAALALLPLSSALAQEADAPSSAAETALEAAAEAFEARMEAFGERAEAIGDDDSLSESEQEMRIAALWTEYAPAVAEFAAMATAQAGAIAAEALADIDMDALVADAMSQVDVSGAMAMASGMAQNGAWASNDPEHMATYGLMADYALGQAEDMDETIQTEVEAALAEAEAEAEIDAD